MIGLINCFLSTDLLRIRNFDALNNNLICFLSALYKWDLNNVYPNLTNGKLNIHVSD
jgi:hypothetical protein